MERQLVIGNAGTESAVESLKSLAQVSNSRPAGQMWLAKSIYVARESFQVAWFY